MTNLPGGPASAATRATAQLQGVDWRGDPAPEGGSEPPLSPAVAELVLLDELVEQHQSQLTRAERRRVRRAVRRGTAVDNPQFAPAAVARAQWAVRDAMTTLPWRGLSSVWVGPVLVMIAVVLGMSDDDGIVDTGISIAVLFALAVVVVQAVRMSVPARRRAARAARAEELNRKLLPTQVQPGG